MKPWGRKRKKNVSILNLPKVTFSVIELNTKTYHNVCRKRERYHWFEYHSVAAGSRGQFQKISHDCFLLNWWVYQVWNLSPASKTLFLQQHLPFDHLKENYTFKLFNNFYEKQVIFTMATGINAKECLSQVSLFCVWLRGFWRCWILSITLIKRHSKNVLESLINYLKWFTFINRGIYFIQLFLNFKENLNWHFGIPQAPPFQLLRINLYCKLT